VGNSRSRARSEEAIEHQVTWVGRNLQDVLDQTFWLRGREGGLFAKNGLDLGFGCAIGTNQFMGKDGFWRSALAVICIDAVVGAPALLGFHPLDAITFFLDLLGTPTPASLA